MANTTGYRMLGVTDDLLAVNAEVCRELWRMVDIKGGTVGALTPKLILPPRNNEDFRISEQEARFIYTSVLTRASRYFFSVETPTREKYSFTKDAVSPRSALSDLSLYTFDDGFKKQANVEFKAGNPPVDHLKKDIEKLVRERVAGNWFHLLKNVDSGTLPSLFGKFQEVFQMPEVTAHVKNMEPIVFCFCVLDKKRAILKIFIPPDNNLEDYCRDFFNIDYGVSGGEVRIVNSRGWVEIV